MYVHGEKYISELKFEWIQYMHQIFLIIYSPNCPSSIRWIECYREIKNIFIHQSTKYIPIKNCVSAYETESHTISRDVNFSRYQDFVTKHSIKFV